MSQTGGMCSAAELLLDSDEDGGHKYVMITWSEDTRRERGVREAVVVLLIMIR